MTDQRDTYDVDVGVGRNLRAIQRVAPADSQSGISVVEHRLPPKKLAAPLHRHTEEDEISYVIEGTMGVEEDGEVSTVEAGEIAVKARDTWHTFWNPGEEELRFLEIVAPGEFAGYFAAMDEILPPSGVAGPDELAELEELHAEYGFELDPESVPDLLERHDLEM